MKVAQLGPVGGAFYLDDSEVAVIEGPVGSGKTTAACLRLGRHAYAQVPSPNGVGETVFAVVRNTKRQLEDTTMATWRQVFPEAVYGPIQKMEQEWRFKPKGHDWPIHARFIFRALDDPADVSNLLSLETTGFFMNEVREANEAIIGHLRGRCRFLNGVRPQTWSGWIGDTNSWDIDHWLEERLVTNPREGWRHFRQPGGMEPEAENLDNLAQTAETLALPVGHPLRLAQGRKYYEKLLVDFSKEDADIYVHALRAPTRTGKPIYTEFNERLHCNPFELDPRLPLRIGMDFGRTPAGLIAQRDLLGRWRVRYELCAEDMGLEKFAPEFKRLLHDKFPRGFQIEQFTGDPAGEQQDAYDSTVFDILRAAGFDMARPATTNEPTLRVGAVQDLLRKMIAGEPALVIHPECRMLRRACLDGYHYRKLKVAGDRYADRPEKNRYSHPAEALQYLLLGGGEGKALVRRTPSRPKQRYAIT